MIRVEDVSFAYSPEAPVLKNVSLAIPEGEFIAVMGENGAGKTTLVKHLNGLLKPSSGRVIVDGVETTKSTVAQLSRKVGLVFQNPDHQLFCETVEDEVAFALKNYGFDEATIKQRVAYVLDLLDLSSYRDSSPLLLSGGEKKRAALACVLAWEPKYIVIDEPTIGQDYGQKQKLRDFLRNLNSEGKTVIIVTHDVEFAAECSSTVILMSGGKIIAEGSKDKVLTDPDIVTKAALVLPQVVEVFQMFPEWNFPRKVFDIDEAKGLILRKFSEVNRCR
jgi:energy-coupling factor transport system ATP-binding protein